MHAPDLEATSDAPQPADTWMRTRRSSACRRRPSPAYCIVASAYPPQVELARAPETTFARGVARTRRHRADAVIGISFGGAIPPPGNLTAAVIHACRRSQKLRCSCGPRPHAAGDTDSCGPNPPIGLPAIVPCMGVCNRAAIIIVSGGPTSALLACSTANFNNRQ